MHVISSLPRILFYSFFYFMSAVSDLLYRAVHSPQLTTSATLPHSSNSLLFSSSRFVFTPSHSYLPSNREIALYYKNEYHATIIQKPMVHLKITVLDSVRGVGDFESLTLFIAALPTGNVSSYRPRVFVTYEHSHQVSSRMTSDDILTKGGKISNVR